MNRIDRVNMMEDIKLDITSEGLVNVDCSGQNNAKVKKIITLDTLANILKTDEDIMNLPMFPMGIRKYYKRGSRTLVAIEYPATIMKEVSFGSDGKKYKDIPVPRSIWLYLLSEKEGRTDTFKLLRTNIYSLKLPLLGENDSLYQWPFPNHATDYGSGVCWGNDKNAKAIGNNCTLMNLSSLYGIYFSSGFNNDLGWKMDCGTESRSGNTLLKHMSGKEDFETSWLLTSGNSFSQAVKALIGERR